MMDFEKVMAKVLAHFAGATFKEELNRAKMEFFGNISLLQENTFQYELRMSQFYDWYFFTRELDGYGQTPLEACGLVRDLRFTEEEERVLEKLKIHRHSLFEFLKIKGEDVYIRDLFRNEKIIVKKSPWIYGFDAAEFFEARLIPKDDTFVFSKGICFHPESAQKFISSEVKKHRKNPDLDPEIFMLRLVRMRYKFEQYKHVNPTLIYSEDSQLMAKK